MTRGDILRFAAGAGAALVLALGILRSWPEEAALDIRSIPRDTLAGRLHRGQPIGQTFTGAPLFVDRIEVPFQRMGLARDERIELRYRTEEAESQTRRVECTVPRTPNGTMVFELGDSLLSGNCVHHFELEPLLDGPSEVLVYTRYRALAADRRNPAPGSASCGAVEGALRAKADRLCGIAIAVTSLDPARGPSALALFDEERAEAVRVSRPELPARIADGWAFFPFPPVEESRGRSYRFRVALPPETGVMGRCNQPAWIALHGQPEGSDAAGGMTWAGRLLADRDLVFAVRGRGASSMRRANHRPTDARWAVALAAWSLATGFACLLLGRAARAGRT